MWRYFLISVALLIPCFWHPRIEAGDLSSHLYNAWLVQLIEKGQAPGLELTHPWTNVLFDIALSKLFNAFGAVAAEHLAVPACVLIFTWGAFFFISVMARRLPWGLMPGLAMLAYGWVFHMGFFNFYLSLGLSMWALGFAWRENRRSWLAIPLLVLAFTAHFLPVLWAGSMEVYILSARHFASRHRVWLMSAAVAAILGIRFLLIRKLAGIWTLDQLRFVTGADQIFVFGLEFLFLSSLALGIGVSVLWRTAHRTGWRTILISVPLQLGILTAMGTAFIPGAVWVPQMQAGFTYFSERMSLPLAILLSAVVAECGISTLDRRALTALAAVFFAALYLHTGKLNRMEDEVGQRLDELPAMQLVTGPVMDPGSRITLQAHLIDRACVGRCYSFANYEPSSGQFRVRARPEARIVSTTFAESNAMQTDTFAPGPGDPPIYRIANARGGLSVTLLAWDPDRREQQKEKGPESNADCVR